MGSCKSKKGKLLGVMSAQGAVILCGQTWSEMNSRQEAGSWLSSSHTSEGPECLRPES